MSFKNFFSLVLSWLVLVLLDLDFLPVILIHMWNVYIELCLAISESTHNTLKGSQNLEVFYVFLLKFLYFLAWEFFI